MKYIVLFFLLVNNYVSAQTINLVQARDMMYENNANLKEMKLKYETQKALIRTSFNPNRTSFNYSQGNISSQYNDNSFTINQSIAWPSMYKYQKQYLSQLADAEYTNIQNLELELNIKLRVEWENFQFTQRMLGLLQQLDSLLTIEIATANKMQTAGETSTQLLLSLQLRYEQLVQQKQEYQNKSKEYLIKIATLLQGSDRITPIVEYGKIESLPVKPSLDTLLYYKQSKVRLQSLNSYSNILKYQSYPDFQVAYFNQSIQGKVEYLGVNYNLTRADRLQGFSVGMSIPLFYRATAAYSKANKFSIQADETHLNSLQFEFDKKWDADISHIATLKSKLESNEQRIKPLADKLLIVSKKLYTAGQSSFLSYLLAFEQYIDIETKMLDDIHMYNIAVIKINFNLVNPDSIK
ncbi:MAG: TolC family protein [Bacteroidota bacterium]|nr:TolC family protein [Bacteroidota bacterium]